MKRKELLSVLEKVKSGIASKDIVEAMTYFFFSGTDVITYNDRISIQHPLKTDFTLFVKANDLFKIVSKTSEKVIKLSEKNEKLSIKAKKLNVSLATITDDEVTERINNVSKSLKKAKWTKLPENFIECIKLCSFAASTSESDQTLTCVNIDAKDCLATDNMRVAHAILDEPMKPMFLKASEIGKLCAIDPIKYFSSKSWVHFKNEDDCIFSIRKVDGDFPNCLPVFDFDGVVIDLPKTILEGMEITSIFVDDYTPAINIKISKGKCIVYVKSEAGRAKHLSKIDYDGKDVEFAINPNFLKEMMSYSTTVTVSDTRAKLETDNFAMVTSLFGDE